ncbi:non-hydrolyzing UDP-N-acetylglucosamine 2-epimerase [Candidatus Riflebacteria bacterium]
MAAKCKIFNVVGARPNFMKIAPILREMLNSSFIEPILVHTGQHYDPELSKNFFSDLSIPEPDYHLEVGSASHAAQTARVMLCFEKTMLKEKPDAVLVVGDVNSTLACSLVAAKEGVPVIHVEAGLRSFDWTMPEEINRVLTDQLSDILFTTSEEAEGHLKKEGVRGKIFYCGNVMIDTLLYNLPFCEKYEEKYPFLKERSYAVLTLHRPANVDNKETFLELLDFLVEECKKHPIIFPIHPRTLKKVKEFQLLSHFNIVKQLTSEPEQGCIYCLPALAYKEMLYLTSKALCIYTDSGGVQEEATVLRVPCLTLRENTERPITLSSGSNVLGGTKKDSLQKARTRLYAMFNSIDSLKIPPLWDGCAAKRIVAELENLIQKNEL